MRWPKLVTILLLFALAAILAGGNMWFTAARSTIPLALDTKVLGKEIRGEKHAGKDDVFMLRLAGLGAMQVDREVYDHVEVGQTLQKDWHSRQLRHGDQVLDLHWSRDHHAMLKAMPICLALLAALLACNFSCSHAELGNEVVSLCPVSRTSPSPALPASRLAAPGASAGR